MPCNIFVRGKLWGIYILCGRAVLNPRPIIFMHGVYYIMVIHCIARGCNLHGKLHPLHGFKTTLMPRLWSYGPYDPMLGGWGLEAPKPSYSLDHFRNRLVLGLYAHFGACSRLMHTEVRSVEPVPAKLEGEKWRRPNVFICWPFEVP